MKEAMLLGLVALGAIAAPVAAQTAADSAAIRATALDYIEGWYTGDATRMERALHPDLAKRIVFRQGGQEQFNSMTAAELVEGTRRGGGSGTPESERQRDVTILDVFRNVAVVRIVARDWVDYLQMTRWRGRWVIVNVLWELKQDPA